MSESMLPEGALVLNALILVLATLGLGQILSLLFGFLTFAYRAWIRKPHNLSQLYGENGWACITGATDGIGKSLAFALAKRGLNILLLSRTQSRLEETRAELLAKYPNVKVEYMQVDFSSPAVDYAAIDQRLRALPGGTGLALLINNVGISYDFPMFFDELSKERVEDMIRLNIDSTTQMTKLALDIFKAKPKASKRRGAIINIGSAAGLCSNPMLTQYSAAKAYVQRFSEGLAVEYKPQGIDIQCHVPFFIVSKLSKFRRASAFVPSSDAYASQVVRAVGQHEVVVNPYAPHALLSFFIKNWIPNALRERFTRNHHVGIRARAMKKKESKAE